MITYHKDYGCWFQMSEDSRHYGLFEMKTYKHNSTSDIVVVWDHDNHEFVNYVYGANTLSVDELDKIVTEYVTEYEAKRKRAHKARAYIKHGFNEAGIKDFEDQASADFFEEFEKPYDDQHLENFDIMVSCGNHQIRIPLGAEEWNELTYYLKGCLEVNQ